MRNVKTLAFAAAACLLLAGSLRAQTGTGQVKWVGVNLTSAWASFSQSSSGSPYQNVYTSPYRARFSITNPSTPSQLLPPAGYGSGVFGPTADIFCVDFDHYANTGTYSAYFTNLGAAKANVSLLGDYTRQGGLTGLQKYLAAAYLSQQIEMVGANTTAGKDMSGAIWAIMSGNPFYRYSGGSWVGTAIHNYVYAAMDSSNTGTGGWHTVNASDWVVVTDQSFKNGGSQEYLTQVTPEPATLLLLGTGLVVMLMAAGAFRRPTV